RLNPYFTDIGVLDFSIVDELIAKAKARGIRIYLDTVANHTSPLNATSWSLERLKQLEPLGGSADFPRSHRGALFRDGQYVISYDEDVKRKRDVPNYRPWFHQFGKNIGEVNGSSDWDNPFLVENYNLQGLADLDQDNPETDRYL